MKYIAVVHIKNIKYTKSLGLRMLLLNISIILFKILHLLIL